jgi:hypothetical protein
VEECFDSKRGFVEGKMFRFHPNPTPSANVWYTSPIVLNAVIFLVSVENAAPL